MNSIARIDDGFQRRSLFIDSLQMNLFYSSLSYEERVGLSAVGGGEVILRAQSRWLWYNAPNRWNPRISFISDSDKKKSPPI